MKKLTFLVFFVIASAVLILSNCEQKTDPPGNTEVVGGGNTTACKFNKSFQLAPVLPSFKVTDNCLAAQYAWQTFVFLNWPADPNNPGQPDRSKTIADFGKPAINETHAVWESFKDIFDIFTTSAPDTSFASATPGPCRRPIRMTDKDHLSEVNQAFTSWLTDVDGNLAFYEVRVNQDEFEFIVKNELYNRQNLAPFAKSNNGLWLPDGSTAQYKTGAMEVKGSWKIINNLADTSNYFTILACVPQVVLQNGKAVIPADAEYTEQVVGLVGMHVAWKTKDAPQWLWATFEHKDNVPMESDTANLTQQYSFYDKASPIATNAQPTSLGANADLSIPCKVTRVDAIDPNAVILNKAFQDMLRQANPSSVFANYELIGLTWPQTPVAGSQNPNAQNPGQISYQSSDKYFLAEGDPQPGVFLRNTTMESYLVSGKNKSSCIRCHSQAYLPNPCPPNTIPCPGDSGFTSTEPIWASDYSWIFLRAQAQK